MDTRNEPPSGWNLPPGCSDSTIDALFGSADGDAETCGGCAHAVEVRMLDGRAVLACALGGRDGDVADLAEVDPTDTACEFHDGF